MSTGTDRHRRHMVERGLAVLVLVATIGFAAPPAVRAATLAGWQEQDVETLYERALTLNLQGEWEDALVLFRRIAAGSSARAAEAAFYTGLCLENLSGRDAEAFTAFAELRSRFPASPFASKALSHQVNLAGVMGEEDPYYRDFLVHQIESGNDAIRHEAALSLARLGDERAVPGLLDVLEHGSSDQKMLVLDRIPAFAQNVAEDLAARAVRLTRGTPLGARAVEIRTLLEAQRAERERLEHLIATDRRFLLEQLKRTGEAWTEEELITQGLFHIMPVATFARYIQAGPAEREEIYEDFFRSQEDPYPETPEQEMELEFRRRIQHARQYFSEPWKAARSRYQANDWLTADNVYAPWDCRGELYIKFGEPDNIYMLGFNQEEWLYARFRVDFTVMKYKVNFYRNAIYPGRVSQMDYGQGWVQATFIDSPRFEYWPKR